MLVQSSVTSKCLSLSKAKLYYCGTNTVLKPSICILRQCWMCDQFFPFLILWWPRRFKIQCKKEMFKWKKH